MKDQADRLRQIALNARVKIEQEILTSQSQTKVIVISSGKGGTGKSTIALNLSVELCQRGKKVILFDADLGLANIDIMLGIVPKYNLYHVVNDKKSIQDIIIHTEEGLDIIPGGSGVYELANLSNEKLKSIITQLGRLDNVYDYMIIDTGAGLSENVLTFLLAADDVIIVTTPEPTSITDAYGIMKSLSNRKFPGAVYLIVNRVFDSNEGLMVAEKFKLVSQKFLNIDITPLGYVINEPLVSEGIRRQKSFIKLFPRSIAAKNINNIADNLLSKGEVVITETPQRSGIRNFFRKITGINR
ncbi:MAG: MinD/ParA family protein [Syntrophomonadaceae bacterium]|nr:MinD/ParA family protein [Syntrophomonadaceae bacterium]